MLCAFSCVPHNKMSWSLCSDSAPDISTQYFTQTKIETASSVALLSDLCWAAVRKSTPLLMLWIGTSQRFLIPLTMVYFWAGSMGWICGLSYLNDGFQYKCMSTFSFISVLLVARLGENLFSFLLPYMVHGQRLSIFKGYVPGRKSFSGIHRERCTC